MNYELRPCPFCGGKAVFNEKENREYAEERMAAGEGYLVQITCPECHVDMNEYSHRHPDESLDEIIDALVKKWNRRPTDKSAEYEKLCGEAGKATANLIKEIKKNTILRQTIVKLAIEHTGTDKEGEY